MRCKTLFAIFGIILVTSRTLCVGEYWLDETQDSFKWFGSRTEGIFDSIEEKNALGAFKDGIYSFRPIPESAESANPEIVIEFKLNGSSPSDGTELWVIHSSLANIYVNEIIFAPNPKLRALKSQTRQMGKTMAALFYKGIFGLCEQMNHRLLEMLVSFVVALSTMERPDLSVQELSREFARGMDEYMRYGERYKEISKYSDKNLLTEEQISLVMNFTEGAVKELGDVKDKHSSTSSFIRFVANIAYCTAEFSDMLEPSSCSESQQKKLYKFISHA